MRDSRLNKNTLGEVWVIPKDAGIKLSHNFSSNEFDCSSDLSPDNHFTLVSWLLVEELQWFRDLIMLPVTITSGFRTAAHNKAIKGSVNSFHTVGLAADIVVPAYDWEHTKLYIDQFKARKSIGGIGYYPTDKFFHVDIRPRIDGEIVTWTTGT